MAISDAARRLHQEAYVVDGLLTGPPSPSHVDRLLRGGYNAANWTVAGHTETAEDAMKKIATFYWLRDALPDKVRVVTCAADLDGTSADGALRVLMGFQGAEPIGHEFHFVSIFHALGVRVIQLTYNEENYLGAGCLEPHDRGLTHFGIQVVRELNRLNMVVDVTHAGERTSLDVIAVSAAPVIFSHSNAKKVWDNPRNLTDEQLRAAAGCGGVVGVATFADFVGDTRRGQPTLDQLLDHICYIAELIGVDHVGIGTDVMEATGVSPVWWGANTQRRYPEICGAMTAEMHNIAGFELWEEFGNITDTLLRRGFNEDEVAKIIGGNFRRVFQRVMRS